MAGEEAVEAVQSQEARLQAVAGALKVGPEDVEQRLAQVLERQRALEKELEALKSSLAASGSDQITFATRNLGGATPATYRIDGDTNDTLVIYDTVGVWLMRDRELQTLDERKILAEAQTRAEALVKRAG